MAGYSTRSLVEKLGIKEGHNIALVNEPHEFRKVLGKLPQTTEKGEKAYDFIQLFAKEKQKLSLQFPILKKKLVSNGALWVSWPKGGSKIPTNLTENIIRDIGLANGMVDVKVIAVDEAWSGLKFVFRLKDR